MKGLEGNADTNNDRKITNSELIAYMDDNVSEQASFLEDNKILLYQAILIKF